MFNMNSYNLDSLKEAQELLKGLVDTVYSCLDQEQYHRFVQALVDVEFVVKHFNE